MCVLAIWSISHDYRCSFNVLGSVDIASHETLDCLGLECDIFFEDVIEGAFFGCGYVLDLVGHDVCWWCDAVSFCWAWIMHLKFLTRLPGI